VTAENGTDEHSVVEPEFDWDEYSFETRQVHAGEREDLNNGSRITPIAMTAGFRFDSFDDARDRFAGDADGLIYSRQRNPSGAVAERRIASLEGGTEAIVVASGQAAITSALFALAQSGERIVSTASIYSGTRILFGRSFARFGVTVDYVWDESDDDEWDRVIQPNTKAIFTETIPNPKNDIVDIEQLARVAARHGIPLVVDNTIASPYLIRPIEFGAAIVVHSSTKFLSGHGAGLSGAIVDGGRFDWRRSAKFPTLSEPYSGFHDMIFTDESTTAAFLLRARREGIRDFGACMAPMTAFQILQGIETLPLRMQRHVDNTRKIVAFLDAHDFVASVGYPELAEHPDHDLAQELLPRGCGAVFSFAIRGTRDQGRKFIESLRIFSHLANVGDAKSLVIHPASTTHFRVSAEKLAAAGITEGTIRLSVGLENADDLIEDLSRALYASSKMQ
jgi:O-acetylhomoserine (thiol)-lyase